jgi:hypothetical protein
MWECFNKLKEKESTHAHLIQTSQQKWELKAWWLANPVSEALHPADSDGGPHLKKAFDNDSFTSDYWFSLHAGQRRHNRHGG